MIYLKRVYSDRVDAKPVRVAINPKRIDAYTEGIEGRGCLILVSAGVVYTVVESYDEVNEMVLQSELDG